MTDNLSLAYFISPHGYGHAARAMAVMAALSQRQPDLRFEVYTSVPAWFFADSALADRLRLHHLVTDVGLVQKSPVEEDIPATLSQLAALIPYRSDQLTDLAGQLQAQQVRAVLCDIAPLGLAVAQTAGLPSILIENFTWDWIYRGYTAQDGRMGEMADYLASIFAQADYHLQTEPICQPDPTASLKVGPISRKLRQPPAQVRQTLGIDSARKLVLLTMGGVPWEYDSLTAFEQFPAVDFLLTGSQATQLERRGNVLLLPRTNDLYHPDIVNASDAVIGKVGYSTLAEIYQAGVPFGYVPRPQFRESAVLVAYIERNLPSVCLPEASFFDQSWLNRLPELLALSRLAKPTENGADAVAEFVLAQVLGA